MAARGDDAVGRPQPIHTAIPGWIADGAAEIAPQVESSQTGRNRGRRTARGSTDGALQIPRIARRTEDRIEGLAVGGIGRQVRLAKDDRAGSAQPRHRVGVARWDVCGVFGSASGRPQSSGFERVLDRDRQPVQGSPALAARECRVGCRRLFERALVEGHHGVHRGVESLDSCAIVPQQFAAADLARAQTSRERGRRLERQVNFGAKHMVSPRVDPFSCRREGRPRELRVAA